MADRITRDAFVYLDPSGNEDEFAQCGTCAIYDEDAQRCGLLGPDLQVDPDDSCGLYVPGEPGAMVPDDGPEAYVSAEQAGFVSRQVRCENCTYYNADMQGCDLYYKLNKALPQMFNLDTRVDAKGCCNAQTPANGAVEQTAKRTGILVRALVARAAQRRR
jgi:hypothetical protein